MTTPEIALRILQSFPSPGQVLALSYMNEAKDRLYQDESDTRELLDRLSDGWAWLVAKGMLGPAYIWGDLNPNWQRTTERGDAWARDERAITRIVAEEQLAFRLHPPSRVLLHNAPDLRRGNIVLWEQPLADRLAARPVRLEVHMETQSILSRTLLIFVSTFSAAVATLAVVVWGVMRQGRKAAPVAGGSQRA